MRLAIVGATGEVGRTALCILESRLPEIEEICLLASERSTGQTLAFRGRTVTVQSAAQFDPDQADYAIFSAGSAVSKELATKFAAAGCTVVDNSSQFRYDDDKLLIVPEVNGDLLAAAPRDSIIANPNCSTIQIVVALAPIARVFGLSRINVCTYQAVSGAGRKGIDALSGDSPWESAFAKPIAANVIPQIDAFQANGYTKEEMKVVWESRKILGLPDLPVNVTAVRVPVVNGHSAAVHLETHTKVSAGQAIELLRQSPGLVVFDGEEFPTALDADGTDPVYVGRIREDISSPLGLNLWVVADNLRKGAALNAIQIIEALAETHAGLRVK